MIFSSVKSEVSSYRLVIGFLSIALMTALAGCQSSGESYDAEEATNESTDMVADTTRVDTTAVDATTIQAPQVTEAEKMQEQMRKEMEDLKTENIALRQKASAMEKKNRELMAKVSDLEAAQTASQEQMAKAKTAPVVRTTKAVGEKATARQIAQYDKAVALAKKNKFQDCIAKMQAVLDAGIGADYVGNAYYWMGLCHFGMTDYKAAADQFREVLNQPASQKKEAAQYMLWKALRKSGNTSAALAEARKLMDEYPKSQYAREVKASMK
ncbi:MAG: tetratricopeptide repeat protein [Ignavibacteriales bacterium]|nr:tetratricopeptide repeat protein [Ignavibacteriales bacterium]